MLTKIPQTKMGAMVEGDQDEFKRVLTEGNPLLLGLTFVVSLLHSVFDMLAFKNDIGFWKNKKSMEGLSIKTIFINAFCQVPTPSVMVWCSRMMCMALLHPADVLLLHSHSTGGVELNLLTLQAPPSC